MFSLVVSSQWYTQLASKMNFHFQLFCVLVLLLTLFKTGKNSLDWVCLLIITYEFFKDVFVCSEVYLEHSRNFSTLVKKRKNIVVHFLTDEYVKFKKIKVCQWHKRSYYIIIIFCWNCLYVYPVFSNAVQKILRVKICIIC